MSRQSKKVKARKREKIEMASKDEDKMLKAYNALNAYHWSGVDLDNPIVLDFYNALKKQKVFGSFCFLFKVTSLDPREKRCALSQELIRFHSITIRPIGDNDFIKRLKILSRMIVYNQYNRYRPNVYSRMTVPKALEYYAREYLKDKKFPIKHSLLYYQFVFGTITVIIGLLMIFRLIYYFWGGLALVLTLIAIFVYSCVGIYELCK